MCRTCLHLMISSELKSWLNYQSRADRTHGVTCNKTPFWNNWIGSSQRLIGYSLTPTPWLNPLGALYPIMFHAMWSFKPKSPKVNYFALKTFGLHTQDSWMWFLLLGPSPSNMAKIIMQPRCYVRNSKLFDRPLVVGARISPDYRPQLKTLIKRFSRWTHLRKREI